MTMYTHKLLRFLQMFLLNYLLYSYHSLYVMISCSFADVFVLILLTIAWLISDGNVSGTGILNTLTFVLKMKHRHKTLTL